MEFNKKTIKFARTNNGVPALWESLRKFPTMERITYIFDQDGNTVEPIFNRLGTNSSLIPIRENYLILKFFFDKEGCGISIARIVSLDCYSNVSEVEIIQRKPSGSDEWILNELATGLNESANSKLAIIISNILGSLKKK